MPSPPLPSSDEIRHPKPSATRSATLAGMRSDGSVLNFVGTSGGAAVYAVLLVLSCCVSAVWARKIRDPTPDASSSSSWAAAALPAAGTILASWWYVRKMDKASAGGDLAAAAAAEVAKPNTDPSLTYRHDRGQAKLVPLVPGMDEKTNEGRAIKDTEGDHSEISADVKSKGKNTTNKLPSYRMEEVAKRNGRNEDGQFGSDMWIVVDGCVYDVTDFADRHPGGPLVVRNMAGTDCSDAFANYHQARVFSQWLPKFRIGTVSDPPKVPPHVQDFRAVREELLRRGLFKIDDGYYYNLYAWFLTLLTSSIYLTLACSSATAHMVGAALLGLFWQQVAGVGHDMGHSNVTHRFYDDHRTGSTIGCVLMGISTGWWKRSHNTHHVVCNNVEADPDIQHMPVMAVDEKIIERPFWSTYHDKIVKPDVISRWFVANQEYLFWPMMALARFNLYVQSWIMICTPSYKMYNRREEAFCMVLFAAWVLGLALSLPTWTESVAWVLISHAVSGILHIQIVISHWSMDTYRDNEKSTTTDGRTKHYDEWYEMQLRTTMDVDIPAWMDWSFIGLQFQVIHHLFPMLPRHNLRIARDMVAKVCKKHDLPYHCPSFFQSIRETVDALRRTAARARAGDASAPNLIKEAMNASG